MRPDPARPDPFAHAGYQGTIDRSAERAELASLELKISSPISLDVACYAFANGWGAGVLLADRARPACSASDPAHPFEMAVLHGDNLRICYASGLTSEVLCGLTRAGVRRWLTRIAELALRPTCDHGRTRG